MHERHPDSPKLLPSKVCFLQHWLSLTEEQIVKGFGDDRLYQVSLQELKSLGLPPNFEDEDELATDAHAKTSIENATEFIKLRMKVVPNTAENAAKFQEIAVAALENDVKKAEKVK